MSDPFIAQIQIFPYTFAPRDWAYCTGGLLSIGQNTALFSLVGTTYGGDGRTTFGLPDLKGRVPMHAGTGPGLLPTFLGGKQGYPGIILRISELPEHTHTAVGIKQLGIADTPSNQLLATDSSPNAKNYYKDASDPLIEMSPQALSVAGGSDQHENRQPFLALSFMIALDGTYPSRN